MPYTIHHCHDDALEPKINYKVTNISKNILKNSRCLLVLSGKQSRFRRDNQVMREITIFTEFGI